MVMTRTKLCSDPDIVYSPVGFEGGRVQPIKLSIMHQHSVEAVMTASPPTYSSLGHGAFQLGSVQRVIGR